MKKGFYIFLIVFVCLLQQSCFRYHAGMSKVGITVKPIQVFPVDFKKGLYKTNIKILGKEYSGLMFFKKYLDDRGTRMIFMSEFGLKFFDFKLNNKNEFSVEYIIDELNKEKIVSVLKQDMKLLFPINETEIQHYNTSDESISVDKFRRGKHRFYYFKNKDKNQVSKIEYSGPMFKNIKIEIDIYKEEIPSFIKVKHVNIFLKLELKLIK